MSDLAQLHVRVVAHADWPTLSAGFHDLTFEQSLTYAVAAAARIGGQAQFISIEDAKGPVAAACLRIKTVPLLGRGIVWIASGPMMHPKGGDVPDADRVGEILSALKNYVAKQGHILRLRFPAVTQTPPETILQAIEKFDFFPSKKAASYSTIMVNLDVEEDALMAGLHGKWRNPLRNALKAGIELDQGPIAELGARFHVLYEDVRSVKGFDPDIPPEFYYDLKGPDFRHEVLIAHKDGEDLAGITVGISGENAVYLFGATTDAGRKWNAGYFLTWQGYLFARALGCNLYDLGGIDEESNPTVTRFKRRAGGVEVQAIGPLEARASGIIPKLIGGLENLRSAIRRLKSKG